MISPTNKTENCRRAKKIKSGKKMKNKLLKVGSTPTLFALNKPVPAPKKGR